MKIDQTENRPCKRASEGDVYTSLRLPRSRQRCMMLKRIVNLLTAIVFWGVEKIAAFFRNDHINSGTCVVLMYHDVTAANYNRFIRQMEILPQLATPVATDLIQKLNKDKHHVAVTFDDGFASTIETVLPVLTSKTIPATFFIPTAYWGKEATWITDMNWRSRVGPILTVESLCALGKDNNVTIGSHGMSHRSASEMMDDDVLGELAESKKTLENIIGKDVKMYSFPFGEYEDRHIAMARAAGYDHVFTADHTVATGVDDAVVIGRVEVDPADWPLEFKLKVLGAYRWHPYFTRFKKFLLTMHS